MLGLQVPLIDEEEERQAAADRLAQFLAGRDVQDLDLLSLDLQIEVVLRQAGDGPVGRVRDHGVEADQPHVDGLAQDDVLADRAPVRRTVTSFLPGPRRLGLRGCLRRLVPERQGDGRGRGGAQPPCGASVES